METAAASAPAPGNHAVGDRVGRVEVGRDVERAGADRVGGARQAVEVEVAVEPHHDRVGRRRVHHGQIALLERFDDARSRAHENRRARTHACSHDDRGRLRARAHLVGRRVDAVRRQTLDVVGDPKARVVRCERDPPPGRAQRPDRFRAPGDRRFTAPHHAVEVAADNAGDRPGSRPVVRRRRRRVSHRLRRARAGSRRCRAASRSRAGGAREHRCGRPLADGTTPARSARSR